MRPRMYKRLTKEVEQIFENKIASSYTIRSGFISDSEHPYAYPQSDVLEFRVREIGKVVLKFPGDYPFRPPDILINGESYHRFLRITSNRFLSLYEKMFKGRCSCACHSSVLSSDKWYPGVTLTCIIRDLVKLHRDKCRIGYSLHVSKIVCKKALPDELGRNILAFL